MKTIGQIIKNARIDKSYSLDYLSDITKIKSSFINLIERESWDDLPPFPTVLGFVKSLAGALKINEKLAVATLKRDYPPKKLRIVPKKDVTSKVLWGPKMTFILGIIICLVIFFGYLTIQYLNFIGPPKLTVESPRQNQVVNTGSITVFGNTDSDVLVLVNNQPVLVDSDGKFSVDLEVSQNTKEIQIIAKSRSGKETSVRRTIEVE